MATNTDILNYTWYARFISATYFSALVIIFSFTPFVVQGQKVDSLKALLEKGLARDRRQILFELAYYYTDIDNHVAMSYVNEATYRSEIAGDSLMIVKCGRLKALLYRRFDDMDSSLYVSQKILPIAERNKFDAEIQKILNGLAIVQTFKSSYDEALASYLRIL
ncbi:MAG TPA: hypothetical protein VK589_20730, partial [Chryseolinea sp.]|nr:hypothetical protein [Chryseolinea sp.]